MRYFIKQKLSYAQELRQLEDYLKFLKKALDSENFNKNAPPEYVEKTKKSYDKAKFRYKSLTGKQWSPK